ncbi:acyl carrier protein [Methylobacterium sp. 77]|uniref:acyl carrier protein n=1 Tax=Methylobacterium sp. 77 TaxID=1101192 RepID=UPI0003A695E5|nr:acyl carrier protein [Methylobacterium sp. 77]
MVETDIGARQELAGERHELAGASEEFAAAREAILAFIAGRNPGLVPGSVTGATSLVTSDALDSIGVLDLMMELGDWFGFEIEEDAFELAHFESIDALATFVEAKRAQAQL